MKSKPVTGVEPTQASGQDARQDGPIRGSLAGSDAVVQIGIPPQTPVKHLESHFERLLTNWGEGKLDEADVVKAVREAAGVSKAQSG